MNRPPFSALLFAFALTLAVAGGAALAVDDDAAGDNLYLSAGFTPDPRTVDLVLDTHLDASTLIAPDCHGFVASERPDVAVYYNAGPFPLILSARAEEDMMLIVNAPDGQWYCDDDSGSGLNPSIRFGEPASGHYDIWVGRHIGPGPATARLSISELYSE